MASSSSSGGPFGVREVRSLYPAVTENHLRYLEKWGLVRASTEPREYSFADLTTIKQVAAELDRGTPLRVLLRELAAERQGQLVLDFRADIHAAADAPRAKVVTLQAHRPSGPHIGPGTPLPAAAGPLKDLGFPFSDPQAALAAQYFIEASRLDDGDVQRMEQAAAGYRKALVVDPDLVPGIVNLANIHYARDEMIEAQALYERAIRLEPHCFEAHFNLGNIHHDLGRFQAALLCYHEAVALNPGYADGHFYLAVTLEKSGRSAEAKPHWKTYQELAPEGEWVELAREFSE
jgi:DNA-binding transcriptional MerR regulator